MIEKLKRLSYSSISLLNKNQNKWFKQYILGEWDNEFKSYFVVGKAFHLICENFNKTGKKDINIGIKYIRDEAKKSNYTEPLYKDEAQLQALYDNYFDGTEERMEFAELSITTNQFGIDFIGILDGIKDGIIYDYKAVSSFTNEDNDKGLEKLIEYNIQGGIYMILYKKEFGFTPNKVQFIEVKKSNSTLKYHKKDAIIDMAKLNPNWIDTDESLTKDKLIEKYRLIPKGKNIVEVLYSDELINRCETIINNSIDIIKNMKENLLTEPFSEDSIIKCLITKKG